jgi:hypothetical protein
MSVLDAVRRPEYTGDRRCWPCTVVNAVLVAVAAALAGRRRRSLGLIVFAVGAALIALRGYVVPYTPQFAPKLVERLPFEQLPFAFGFESGRRESGSLAGTETSGEEVMLALLEAGVLDDGEELALDDEFAAEWETEMAALRDGDDGSIARAVAAAAPFDADGRGDGDWVIVDGPEQTAWLTRPVAIAEAAAVRAMAEWGVPERLRATAARPLRMFVPSCPVCGGAVVETTATECCGGTMGVYDTPTTDVLACDDCGALVYEFADVVEEE